MEQSEEMDVEQFQGEEAHDQSSDDDSTERGDNKSVNFNPCLASLHTYLGEVEDTRGRLVFFEGGAILNLPMIYLEGAVLFPEATLPLTVIQRGFKAAVETAMNRADAPCTIGVVHLHRHPVHLAKVGTTAEIRQFRRLEGGSLNAVTRGQQRFRLRHHWMDVDGVPWAEVQIIQEDIPLRTPKEAFGQLASVNNFVGCSCSDMVPSESSFVEKNICESQEKDLLPSLGRISGKSDCSMTDLRTRQLSMDSDARSLNIGKKACVVDKSKLLRRAPKSFWPHWVYLMYDSYSLAQRVTHMWAQIIKVPRLDSLVNKPDLLSFFVASRVPAPESTRQELLEINGVSYRLRKEIQLLEHFDLIRCKDCLTLIAKRSDMVVMSSDGPLNAYANPGGYVHEVMTLVNARGLSLVGSPFKEHSWFPGYAWTVAQCKGCRSPMGWCFTATKKKLQPRLFWGIRSSQVAADGTTAYH